jgi:hypothetical protein
MRARNFNKSALKKLHKALLLRLSLVALFASLFSGIIFGHTPANAISSNPTPVCSGTFCTMTFTFTGDYYTWTTPYTGAYTLEVWGAQGGNGGAYSSTSRSTGGRGGYAKGEASIAGGTTLNIYPGGRTVEAQVNDSAMELAVVHQIFAKEALRYQTESLSQVVVVVVETQLAVHS